MKEQKDLSDEYAEKEYKRVNGDSASIFTDETCFTFEDIKYAFDAGRESVVENIPELEWEYEDRFGDVNSGNCTVFVEKGDYAESEVLEMFIEGVKTNFDFKNEQIVITNIINLTKIRRELEE